MLATATALAAAPAVAYADSGPVAPVVVAPANVAPANVDPVTGAPVTGAQTTGAPVTGAPVTGAPASGAPITGGIPLINTSEKIGPGIDLQHVKALDQKGWYDAQFLNVDLSKRAVGTDLLTSGPVASGGPLSVAANKAGAVAGVNGEFFDIGASNAALGGEVQNGQLVKSADISGRQHVGVSKDGIAQLVDLTVNARRRRHH
ncbi:hypothetical protein ACFYPZ_14365 [Streptomyces sp. NPDC005506]|uniref:hypothetical protein n=1 Tax=unclassified Streptomyces TaxID=2593676 RepID=UPI0036BDBE17